METGLIVSIAAILVLLVLSAFFSGSETAMTASSRARMHTLSKDGNSKAVLVNKIRDQKDRMIGALLLGNNLVNISASALATGVLIDIFGDGGVFYATVIMTAVVLIFSEVLPKTYAIHHADTMAMKVAPFLNIVIRIFSPVTNMVTMLVRFVLRMFGEDISKVSGGDHLEVLRGAIDMHRGPDEEVSEERAMLRSILDLTEVDVGKVMTHRRQVSMINASQPMEKIIDAVLENPYSRIPLWQDKPENIVGVIHVKTLLKELQHRSGDISGLDLGSMINKPWFVPDTTTLFDQLQAFREKREHFALVVDEYGSFMGVVTLEDILEEIVGDIDDDTAEIVAGVRRQANGSYMIDGSVTIRELNRQFEWNLPDGSYSTLAGLLLHETETLPEVGQSFAFFGFRFDVVKRQRHQITLVRVMPPKKPALLKQAAG